MNDTKVKGFSIHARIRSRRSVVQAYYQWLITQQPVIELVSEFKTDRSELKKADIEYFEKLLSGMISDRKKIDEVLGPLLDRTDKELDPVENAILHLGTYELLYQQSIPYKVVINEAVNLAKLFGAEQSHKYINSVLDKIAYKCRQAEMQIQK